MIVIDYIKSHPEITIFIIGGLINALFKPRTPEEYASMNPYLAKAFVLLGAIFTDPVKVNKLITEIVTGKPPVDS